MSRLGLTVPAVDVTAVLSLPASASADGGEDEPIDATGEVIVITGSRTEKPLAATTVATEVISRARIESSGAANLAELLAGEPGLDVVRSYRGSAIRMQGLDAEYVLVLIDGERAIGRVGGALDVERFSLEEVERIEIVEGASSALYGAGAIAGVINIVTRRPERAVEVRATTTVGSLGRRDAHARVGLRRRSSSLRLDAGWSQGTATTSSPTRSPPRPAPFAISSSPRGAHFPTSASPRGRRRSRRVGERR